MWQTVSVNTKYEVNELGQVRHRLRKKILSPKTDKYGYKIVCLSSGDRLKPQNVSVHRLVATAFIPNPLGYPQVNHKDEDKSNNRADNLEWCTGKYNSNYGTAKIRGAKKRERPVLATKDGEVVARFSSAGAAAKAYGVRRESVRDAVTGRTKICCGYKWLYAE